MSEIISGLETYVTHVKRPFLGTPRKERVTVYSEAPSVETHLAPVRSVSTPTPRLVGTLVVVRTGSPTRVTTSPTTCPSLVVMVLRLVLLLLSVSTSVFLSM